MDDYVLSGMAGKLGMACGQMLLVLATLADIETGLIEGYSVTELGRLCGMSRHAVIAAIDHLEEARYLDRVQHEAGRTTSYRLIHRVHVVDAQGQHQTSVWWPYAPKHEMKRHEALKDYLREGRLVPGIHVEPAPGIHVEQHIHQTVMVQIVEAGGTGIQIAGRDAIAAALRRLSVADTISRMKWCRRAIELGAPAGSSPRPDRIAEWIGLVAQEVANAGSL